MPHKLFDLFGRFMFFLIAVALALMGFVLALTGSWRAVRSVWTEGLGAFDFLNSVGFIIVSVAIMDLSKFVLEEYVLHTRQLRAMPEARRSLTKFMTIIIIAFALEALVATFELSREKMFERLLYPAALMLTAVATLIGVGAFQWMTRAGEREMIEGAGDPTSEEELEQEEDEAGEARLRGARQRSRVAAD